MLLARLGSSLTKRAPLLLTAVRHAQKSMPDPIDHATGLEKKELMAIARGNDNPFNMRSIPKGPGTKAQPTLIPSFHDVRMVGCICHEEAFYVTYMWLHAGEPRRCECGHWYKLTEAVDPFDFKD